MPVEWASVRCVGLNSSIAVFVCNGFAVRNTFKVSTLTVDAVHLLTAIMLA
jgi:hypothetical protein